MIEDCIKIARVLYYVDYDDFLQITQFFDDRYAEKKWIDFSNNQLNAVMYYDANLRKRFDDYIKKHLEK